MQLRKEAFTQLHKIAFTATIISSFSFIEIVVFGGSLTPVFFRALLLDLLKLVNKG